jgi:hypothetical protein
MGLVWITAKTALADDAHIGQQRCQGTGGSGFCRTALTADQHTPNTGINRVQYQGTTHAFLTYNGCKWVNGWHKKSRFEVVLVVFSSL